MTRSRMSYYTSLALVSMLEDTIIPAPPEHQLPITGITPGHWINFVTWSRDGATLAFTLRSAGVQQLGWRVVMSSLTTPSGQYSFMLWF